MFSLLENFETPSPSISSVSVTNKLSLHRALLQRWHSRTYIHFVVLSYSYSWTLLRFSIFHTATTLFLYLNLIHTYIYITCILPFSISLMSFTHMTCKLNWVLFSCCISSSYFSYTLFVRIFHVYEHVSSFYFTCSTLLYIYRPWWCSSELYSRHWNFANIFVKIHAEHSNSLGAIYLMGWNKFWTWNYSVNRLSIKLHCPIIHKPNKFVYWFCKFNLLRPIFIYGFYQIYLLEIFFIL